MLRLALITQCIMTGYVYASHPLLKHA